MIQNHQQKKDTLSETVTVISDTFWDASVPTFITPSVVLLATFTADLENNDHP